MTFDSYLSLIDHRVGTYVTKGDSDLGYEKRETIGLVHIPLPNVLSAMIAVNIQRGMLWVLKEQFQFPVKSVLQAWRQIAVVFLECLGEN